MSGDPTKELPKAPDEALEALTRRVDSLEHAVKQELKQTTPLSSQLTELREYAATCFREIIERQTSMQEQQTRMQEQQTRMEEQQTRMEERQPRWKRGKTPSKKRFERSGGPYDGSIWISQLLFEIRTTWTIG